MKTTRQTATSDAATTTVVRRDSRAERRAAGLASSAIATATAPAIPSTTEAASGPPPVVVSPDTSPGWCAAIATTTAGGTRFTTVQAVQSILEPATSAETTSPAANAISAPRLKVRYITGTVTGRETVAAIRQARRSFDAAIWSATRPPIAARIPRAFQYPSGWYSRP